MEQLPQRNQYQIKIKETCLSWQLEPKKLYDQLEVSTIEEAIKSKSPALSILRRELGIESAKLIVFIWVADLVQFFNVGKTMNEHQVGETVNLIFKRFFFLKPEDIKLCFDNAKSGNYGKLFDRFDGMIILDCLSDYVSKRIESFEQKSDNEHFRSKNEQILPKEVVNVFTEIRTGIEQDYDKEQEFKEFLKKYNESRNCNG